MAEALHYMEQGMRSQLQNPRSKAVASEVRRVELVAEQRLSTVTRETHTALASQRSLTEASLVHAQAEEPFQTVVPTQPENPVHFQLDTGRKQTRPIHAPKTPGLEDRR